MADKAEMALRIVREAPKMAYDTETSGLDWKVNQPVGYVITESAENNFYIPVRHGGGGNLLDGDCPPLVTATDKIVIHSFEAELAKAFEERRRRKFLTIGHNLKFDMHFSANAGIYLGRDCEDTGINEPMCDEHARSFSLDSCAIRRGVTAKKGEELYEHLAKLFGGPAKREQMGNYWRTAGNDPIVVDYALGDGITTLELREKQIAQIIEEQMEQIHSIESQLVWTFFRMERRGIKVDMAKIDELVEAVKGEIAAAEAKLPPRFNVKSAPQVKEFMEAAGHTDYPLTPLGAASFTEKYLKTKEEGRTIIAVRQLHNLLSKFVTPLQERYIHEGRVHCNINQLKGDETGTIAGRISASDPNLLAIPKRNKVLGRRFRSLFPADDGMSFYEADYKQCEPVLFAHYSQEPSLIDGYNALPPRDMHQVVADMLEVERDPTAKRMNMGILTGMQKQTFAAHMEWPLDRASEAFDAWFRVFPGIKTFQNQAKKAYIARGWVRTLLGRRCRIDDYRFAYKATSRIIQGGNADIMKYKLLMVDIFLEERGDTSWLQLSVYDSAEWQSPDTPEGREEAALMVAIFKDCQTAPLNLRVPLGMDVGNGTTWAIATYGEEKTNA